jgi:hypothetical protein
MNQHAIQQRNHLVNKLTNQQRIQLINQITIQQKNSSYQQKVNKEISKETIKQMNR